MRSLLAAALAALALAACGEAPSTQTAAPAQTGQAACPTNAGAVGLRTTRNMPDWLMIARTRDGGYVHFNQRTIVRNPDCTADIWVQVRHGRQQLYGAEGATYDTTVRFELERMQYRFDCAEDRFVVLRRQFIGPNETIAAEAPMRTDLWRATPPNGPAALARPVACRGR